MTESIVVKEIVEPKSGRIHRTYTYKRKLCRRVMLESRLCSQLAGYVLIEKDLRSVLLWLQEIDRLDERPLAERTRSAKAPNRKTYSVVKGLFVAALTFYGKCFTRCDGRPVKLERAQIEERFREGHDDCISYRNNFAAHSGAKKLETVEIALVFPLKYKNPIEFQIFKELNQPDFFRSAPGESSLIELVEHVRSIANSKIDVLSTKIRDEEVIANAGKYWEAR